MYDLRRWHHDRWGNNSPYHPLARCLDVDNSLANGRAITAIITRDCREKKKREKKRREGRERERKKKMGQKRGKRLKKERKKKKGEREKERGNHPIFFFFAGFKHVLLLSFFIERIYKRDQA